MKKRLSLLLLLTLALCLVLTSCGSVVISYPNSDNYSKGNVELKADITVLDIEWLSGAVNISYHDSDEIYCYESANRELKEHEELRWYVDRGTLIIKYAEVGRWNFSALNKTLELKLPRGLSLNSLKFDGISSDLKLSETKLNTMVFDSTSGNLTMENVDLLTSFEAESVSGNYEISFSYAPMVIDIESVSGNVNLSAQRLVNASFETTSGDINITADTIVNELEIDAVSGDVTLKLPETSAFKLYYEKTSGDLSSEIPLTTNKTHYVAGNGGAQIDVETTSGNLTILKK